MKKILQIHVSLWVIIAWLFFGLGNIDKKRFEAASLSHKPSLLFSHDKLLVKDGGSIYWESLIYSAHEGRGMRAWEEDGETKIADGFQGIWWTWKYHNLVWLYLIIGGSFVGSSISCYRKNLAKQVVSGNSEPAS